MAELNIGEGRYKCPQKKGSLKKSSKISRNTTTTESFVDKFSNLTEFQGKWLGL